MLLFRNIFFLITFFPLLLFSQTNGLVENFNDGNISRWTADHPRTFQLSAEDGTLKVNYTRTPSSDQWDNFNYTPPQLVNMANSPKVVLRVKSTVTTVFSFKPVYNNNPPLIDRTITGDGNWHTISINITNPAHYQFDKIYMYFDGGTTQSKSGTVWFDEIRFGDSAVVNVPADWTEFDRAVTAAEALLNNAVMGYGEGEFFPGADAALQTILVEIKNIKTQGTTDQAVVDQAVWDLYDACVNFETSVSAVQTNLNDTIATKETRYLYLNLLQFSRRSLMFGMHDATGYGVGWSGDDERSDVKDVVGDYPALYSEDMNGIELETGVEGSRNRLTAAYGRGGVITFCWHQYDQTGTSFYAEYLTDKQVVSKYIPGGTHHQEYKNKLLKVAKFLKSFRGSEGESIPVIFRPYHEHLGSWFWWGPPHTTTWEYNTIWQFTVEYLRDSLNVHNLIYAISPSLDHVYSGDQYFQVYPGDNYVDIFGTDFYFDKTNPSNNTGLFLTGLRTVVNHALDKNKIPALTEVGQETIPTTDWFTNYLLQPIKNDDIASNIVYAAVWRNASTTHHYASYPGHSSVPDFIEFYNDPYTVFESDLPDMYALPVEDTTPPQFVSNHDTVQIAITTTAAINVVTDERAFLKYSFVDESYETMPNQFTGGEGSYDHSVQIEGTQGETTEIFVRASDVFGNVTDQSLRILFKVDTMQAPVAWYDSRYPVTDWLNGNAVLGTSASAVTLISPVRTAYFKTNFTIEQLPTAAAVILKCVGGGAVYINNLEIGRINLPEDIVLEYNTDPTVVASVTKQFILDSSALASLKIGSNHVASEIHGSPTGSVESFDLKIINQSNQTFLPFGSLWSYFDKGYKPQDMKLADIVSVDYDNRIPGRFELFANYPNPFNPSTKIRYQLAKEVKVKLEVYNILGERIKTLIDNNQAPGIYEIEFNGSSLTSGVYIVLLKAADFLKTQKIMLIK